MNLSNVLGNSKIPTGREEKADRQTTALHDFPKKQKDPKKDRRHALEKQEKTD